MLKATFLLDDIRQGITFAIHGVSSRSPLPALSNFLIEAKKEGLIITSTDLEIGIQVLIPAKIENEGRITVPAKTLLDLINSLDGDKAVIEQVGKELVLTTGRTKTKFPTQDAEGFPSLFEEKGEMITEFSKKELEKDLERTVFAAAQDTSRPALSGLLFEEDEGGVNIVATDGFRLSLTSDSKAKLRPKKGTKLLISAKVVREVLSLKTNEIITLFASEKNNQVVFESGDIIITGRLIEAEYPDYQKIIPQDHNTKAVFDREKALSAVRSCSVFAREAANIVKIGITDKELVFSASASSAGENEVGLEAKVEGEANEISFNARYLIDLLSSLEGEEVSLEMTSPLSPGVFRVVGDKTFLHLIMPIRVQE